MKRPVYDSLAEHYDRAFAPLERWFLSRWRTEALAELPAGSRILEIGAGTGLNFSHYPPGTREVVATEPSREMIRRAQEKSRRAPHILLARSRAEALPFPDNSFDAACATLIFCSVGSPRRAFRELQRVVRRGGRVVLLEHVRPESRLLGPLFDALSLVTVPLFEDHFNRRTAREAGLAGLQVERVRGRALGIVQMIVCRV